MGRITGKATVNFGYPVLDDADHLRAVVFAALDLAWLAFDFDVVVVEMRADLQCRFQKFQVFVKGAEELADASGDSYGLFH